MKHYTFRTIIEVDGKLFHGYVPALPGCHTFGKTILETRKHMRDAITEYLKSMIDDGKKISEDKGFESFETIPLLMKKQYA